MTKRSAAPSIVLSCLLSGLHSVALSAAAEAATERYTLVTSSGPIGTLAIDARGTTVDTTWRVDDNGRGSKLAEHVELGAAGLPVRWTIEGKGWFGAPVKESFASAAGRAKWVSLDDSGEADGGGALYLPNSGTPWGLALYLRVLLGAKDHTHAVLPGGTLRLERLRDVEIANGGGQEKLTAYALWGIDVTPQILLARGDHLVANLQPGWVLAEERLAGTFAALSALAAELSGELLVRLAKKLAHPVDGPLWITNVRVFNPVTGHLGELTNVGIYRGAITGVRGDAPPKDAVVVDGAGGTLLPGLFDSHAHLSDWGALLHIAAGVTLARDPGNDNDTVLALMRRIESGEIAGPRAKLSGFLEGKSPYSAHDGFVVDSVEEATDKVRWYANHGFWGIKIYNSMNPDFVRPIAAEAHRLGLHVSGHVPAFMTSERAVRDGYDEINHINQLMLSFLIGEKEDTRTPFRFTALGERAGKLDLASDNVQRMVKLMKDRKTALDPTLATFSAVLLARPGKACPADANWLDHMPGPMQRARKSATLDVKPEHYGAYAASWKKMEEMLLLLWKQGIPLVPGTDDVPGMVLHSELEAWVQAGIPAASTLTAATIGGARLLGLDGQLGSVVQGMRADLYLIDGDPTKDISAIRRGRLVVQGSRVYYPDEIHTALGIRPFATHAVMSKPH